MKNLKSSFVVQIIITMIIMVLIGGGIYYVVEYRYSEPSTVMEGFSNNLIPTKKNIEVDTKQVVDSGSNTSLTKIYKDSKYFFTVNYPNTWIASKGEESDMGGFHYTHFGVSNIYEKPFVWIRVYPRQTSLDNFLRYYKGLSGIWSDTVVDGIPAKKLNNINQDNQGIILIAFVKDGYGYDIASTAFGQYGSVANEMALTFKFASSTNTTSDE